MEAINDGPGIQDGTGSAAEAVGRAAAVAGAGRQQPAVRARPARGPRPEWQTARVTEVIEETAETVTLRLELEKGEGFAAGQYYNVRYPVEGRPRPVQRAYSVGSSPHPPGPGLIDITIKEMEGGLVSPQLVRALQPGHELQVRGPHGNFTWDISEGGPLLLVAAGSGVVPFMAMLRYAIAHGGGPRTVLLFSSKSRELAIYGDELDRMEAEQEWLEVVHTFTRAPDDPRPRYHRRIDAPMVQDSLNRLTSVPAEALGYACGPPEMVDVAEQALLAAGVPKERIRTEKYD